MGPRIAIFDPFPICWVGGLCIPSLEPIFDYNLFEHIF